MYLNESAVNFPNQEDLFDPIVEALVNKMLLARQLLNTYVVVV